MQLSLLLFNLCPAYPLDGGRAVVDLLSMRGVGLERAAAITAGLSVSVGAVICLLALAYAKWTTIMVGAWVLMQAWELLQMVRSVRRAGRLLHSPAAVSAHCRRPARAGAPR